MTPIKCPLCGHTKNIFSEDIKFEPCELCGTQMEAVLEKQPDGTYNTTAEPLKNDVDLLLVSNMKSYIKEQGEDTVWTVLNKTKLEYRLDDLACFFEAKYQLAKENL